jgi:hypothetical protein
MASGGAAYGRSPENVQDDISRLECDIFINEREISKFQAALSKYKEELSNAEPNSKHANILASCISKNTSVVEDLQQIRLKLQDDIDELFRLRDSFNAHSPHTDISNSLHRNGDHEKNWRTAGTLIFHACDQARQFVNDSFFQLHRSVIQHIDSDSSQATASVGSHFSESEFRPQFEDYHQHIRQKFALHVVDCHASFAQGALQSLGRVCNVNDQESYQEFRRRSSKTRIAWRNSDTRFWIGSPLGPFEMAKLFCKSFGSRSPSSFGDLEPGSLFRILIRCTFFTLPWMDTGQLLRLPTLKGCMWSYKRWKAAYSSHKLDSDDLSRIRSLMSSFIQEVDVARSNFAKVASIEKYFQLDLDTFDGESAVSSSIGTSNRDSDSEPDDVSSVASHLDRQESSLNDFDFDDLHDGIMARARDCVDFTHSQIEVQSGTQHANSVYGYKSLQLSVQEFVKLNLEEAYLLIQVSHFHRIFHSRANVLATAFFVPYRHFCIGRSQRQRQDQ